MAASNGATYTLGDRTNRMCGYSQCRGAHPSAYWVRDERLLVLVTVGLMYTVRLTLNDRSSHRSIVFGCQSRPALNRDVRCGVGSGFLRRLDRKSIHGHITGGGNHEKTDLHWSSGLLLFEHRECGPEAGYRRRPKPRPDCKSSARSAPNSWG